MEIIDNARNILVQHISEIIQKLLNFTPLNFTEYCYVFCFIIVGITLFALCGFIIISTLFYLFGCEDVPGHLPEIIDTFVTILSNIINFFIPLLIPATVVVSFIVVILDLLGIQIGVI